MASRPKVPKLRLQNPNQINLPKAAEQILDTIKLSPRGETANEDQPGKTTPRNLPGTTNPSADQSLAAPNANAADWYYL